MNVNCMICITTIKNLLRIWIASFSFINVSKLLKLLHFIPGLSRRIQITQTSVRRGGTHENNRGFRLKPKIQQRQYLLCFYTRIRMNWVRPSVHNMTSLSSLCFNCPSVCPSFWIFRLLFVAGVSVVTCSCLIPFSDCCCAAIINFVFRATSTIVS